MSAIDALNIANQRQQPVEERRAKVEFVSSGTATITFQGSSRAQTAYYPPGAPPEVGTWATVKRVEGGPWIVQGGDADPLVGIRPTSAAEAAAVAAASNLLAEILLTGNQASIDFTGPWSDAKSLLLVAHAMRTDRAGAAFDNIYMRFNGDTTAANYDSMTDIASTTVTNTQSQGTISGMHVAQSTAATALAGSFGNFQARIFSPNASILRNVHAEGMHLRAISNGNVYRMEAWCNWENTSNPINQITLVSANGANFIAGTHVTLHSYP